MTKHDKFSAASIVGFIAWYVREIGVSLKLAARRWQLDDAGSMSAAVAYYLALSVFPLLLLLTSGIGLFLKFTNWGHDAEVQILAVVAEHCSPSLEEQVRKLLLQFEDQSVVGSEFGLLTAIAAAIGVFYQFDCAFDKIWRIPPAKHQGPLQFVSSLLGKRLVAFVMLASVGLTIVAIMAANVAISAIRSWMTNLELAGAIAIIVVDATTTMLLNTIAFGVLYRTLPKRKVSWMDAFRAGLLVAIVWEVGREFLFSFMIGTRYTTYGAVGSFIALLLWFYWGVTILFFGAEYLQVITQRNKKPLTMFDPNKADAPEELDHQDLFHDDAFVETGRQRAFSNQRSRPRRAA